MSEYKFKYKLPDQNQVASHIVIKGEKGDDGHDGSFQIEKVTELPTTGDEGTLYLLEKANPTEKEKYDKWLYTGGKWERLSPDEKQSLETISRSGSNPLDIYKIFPCGFNSASGELSPTATAYWCTDFIPIEPVQNDNRWSIAHCLYEPDNTKHIYKYVYYDENKANIREVRDTTVNNIGMYTGTYPDVSNYKYIRLQFKKSDIPFENAHLVRWSQGQEFFDKTAYNPSNAITTYNIASNAVHNANLTTAAANAVKYASIKGSMNPFDERDLVNTLVKSVDGQLNGLLNNKRLTTAKIFKVPKGTTISVPQDSGWKITVFQYMKDGTYIGTSGWTKSVYLASDTYARFSAFYNVDNADQDISTDEMMSAFLSAITFENADRSFVYEGTKISLANTFSASLTSIATLHQDGAIYDGKILEINSSGYYTIQDTSGNILQAQTALDQQATIAPHANSVCFGTERYDNGDTFPIFYNNAYNNTALPKGSCYVYRLKNDYSTTLLQTIQIGFTSENIWSDGHDIRPYGNFVVDTDNNKLYAFTMKDNIQRVRFFKFALPTLSQGSTVTLAQNDIEEYFDVDYLYLLQGACYHNGKIYALSGNDSGQANSSKLSVINLTTKTIESVISLSQFFSEPETVFVHDGMLYAGQTILYEFKF